MRPTPEPGTPSVTAFPPASSSRQKDGMSFAPGNRQAMPTMATGSCRGEWFPVAIARNAERALSKTGVTRFHRFLRVRMRMSRGRHLHLTSRVAFDSAIPAEHLIRWRIRSHADSPPFDTPNAPQWARCVPAIGGSDRRATVMASYVNDSALPYA